MFFSYCVLDRRWTSMLMDLIIIRGLLSWETRALSTSTNRRTWDWTTSQMWHHFQTKGRIILFFRWILYNVKRQTYVLLSATALGPAAIAAVEAKSLKYSSFEPRFFCPFTVETSCVLGHGPQAFSFLTNISSLASPNRNDPRETE